MAGGEVSPGVRTTAAYAWRFLVIAAALLVVLLVLGRLVTVLAPVMLAIFLIRALSPVADALRRRGARPALAAGGSLVAFLLVVVGVIALIAPAMVDEFSRLGPTLEEALDDVERWIVEDSGLDVTAADVERARNELSDRVREALTSSGGTVIDGAVLAAEVLAGVVIALFLTFFGLKDGRRFQRWSLTFVPEATQPRVRRLAARSWDVLGGYLRGAALLGLVEAVVISVTLALVGGRLVVPVAVLTFVAAFVPFVGAIVAGVVAVLVALASGGLSAAVVVAVVALVVQQLDNDLLAPIIYGRALQLHPAAVILAVAAGGALFGLAGTFLAVPVVAVLAAAVTEVRTPHPVLDGT